MPWLCFRNLSKSANVGVDFVGIFLKIFLSLLVSHLCSQRFICQIKVLHYCYLMLVFILGFDEDTLKD